MTVTELDDTPVALERPAAPPRRSNPIGAGVKFLAGSVPTLLVLAAAGAVFWWGHHSGWTLPKFSEMRGQAAPADDWCAEHGVPESVCVECNPSLLPKAPDYGFCKVHGVPNCPLEHPDVAQLAVTPTITPADFERAAKALAFAPRPTINPNCKTQERRIQFANAAAADKAGVAVEPVWTGPVIESVGAPGEVTYDPTKVAHLSARAPGAVRTVFKHLGDTVAPGDVLALVDAAEVGKAKSDLLLAFADLQLKQLALASVTSVGQAVPEVRRQEVEAAATAAQIRVTAACQALTNLGLQLDERDIRSLTPDQLMAKLRLLGIPADIATVAAVDGKTASTNLLPLVAPMAGTISSRDVVAGEVVDATRVLFEVVDASSLWLTLDLKGEDARRVAPGQTVRFTPDNGQGEVTGTLVYKSTQADVKTRTIKVRADLPNPGGRLPANTFGAGRVILREEPNAIVVPNAAIQWDGCCNVVFVRDKNYLKSKYKVFHVRKVRVGAKTDTTTEIVAGVLPGELVATAGSGVMLTELLRGELGAGCGCGGD
jgi:cobalt-zinc-cadmium efflux system membrane fusion protein